jgi:hypothetical protein
MSTTETFQLFFALLTLLANLAVVALLITRAVVAAQPARAAAADALASVAANGLPLAAAVAITCTLGSLYFSEVANFTPCTLCWYQRIAMYPLALVLPIATFRRDWSVRIYVWPVVAVGAVIALYHYLLERFPSLDAGACSLGVPCEIVWFKEFGFVTLPYMALSGFVLIAVLLLDAPHPVTEEA